MNLDRFDKIKLTTDDLTKLLKWRDNNKNLVRNFYPSLTEGVIEYGNKNAYQQYFKDSGLFVETKVFIMKKLVLHYKWNKLTKTVKVFHYSPVGHLKDYGKSNAIQDATTVHASIMAYIEHYKDDTARLKKKVIVDGLPNTKKKKSKSSNKNKVVKIGRRSHYQVSISKEQSEEKIEIDKEKERKKFTGTWAVRGHWRILKNGNKVWIKSYQKGEGVRKTKVYKM
jgi:hypothetical protein